MDSTPPPDAPVPVRHEATSLVAYLRKLLERAERGEVFYFIGAAGVVEYSSDPRMIRGLVQQYDVHVGAFVAPEVERLDPQSIQNGFVRLNQGLVVAAKSVSAGVDAMIDVARSRQS